MIVRFKSDLSSWAFHKQFTLQTDIRDTETFNSTWNKHDTVITLKRTGCWLTKKRNFKISCAYIIKCRFYVVLMPNSIQTLVIDDEVVNKSLTHRLWCSSYITMCYIIKAIAFIWPLLIRARGQFFFPFGKRKAFTVSRSKTRMSANFRIHGFVLLLWK